MNENVERDIFLYFCRHACHRHAHNFLNEIILEYTVVLSLKNLRFYQARWTDFSANLTGKVNVQQELHHV